MVGIIGKNSEEREIENNLNTLEKLTEELINQNNSKLKFHKSTGDIYICNETEPFDGIRVYPRINLIYVYNEKNFEFARMLAEEYEFQTEEWWTLKKNYTE